MSKADDILKLSRIRLKIQQKIPLDSDDKIFVAKIFKERKKSKS